jgi:hypothetical protein
MSRLVSFARPLSWLDKTKALGRQKAPTQLVERLRAWRIGLVTVERRIVAQLSLAAVSHLATKGRQTR